MMESRENQHQTLYTSVINTYRLPWRSLPTVDIRLVKIIHIQESNILPFCPCSWDPVIMGRWEGEFQAEKTMLKKI